MIPEQNREAIRAAREQTRETSGVMGTYCARRKCAT
jgi:hypothetical protein